jgi:hypothetical protein
MELAVCSSEVKKTLLDLPPEIIQQIVVYLSLQDLCQLGATCHHAHLLTHDEDLWSFQVKKKYRLLNLSNSQLRDVDFRQVWPDLNKFPTDGVLCDSSLQGSRELAIVYSEEFRKILREKSVKKKQDPFRVMLETSIKDILPRLLAFYVAIPREEQCSARLVLFGPGIESPNTKLLVHKIVNARSSTFDAVEFISGLPGGIGSGVRINYKHMYNFDLMCLYTNSEAIRNTLRGYSRLSPAHNRMIVEERSGGEASLRLQPSISHLLPTLHGLLYALDVTVHDDMDVAQVMGHMRKELDIVLDGVGRFNIVLPLSILACTSGERGISLVDLVEGLNLRNLECPWGLWSCEVDNMRGCEKSLDWILHHIHRKRRDWDYHSQQGQS